MASRSPRGLLSFGRGCHRSLQGLPGACHHFRQLPLPLWSWEYSRYVDHDGVVSNVFSAIFDPYIIWKVSYRCHINVTSKRPMPESTCSDTDANCCSGNRLSCNVRLTKISRASSSRQRVTFAASPTHSPMIMKGTTRGRCNSLHLISGQQGLPQPTTIRRNHSLQQELTGT